MSGSSLPTHGTLVVDKSGKMNVDWYRYFQDVQNASGLAGHVFPLFESLFVPCTSMRAPASGAAGFGVFLSGTQGYVFAAATEKSLQFETLLPHGYTPGTDIWPFVIWAPSTTNTGVVRWGIEYTWASADVVFPATVSVTSDDAGSGTANTHQRAEFSAIAGATAGVGKKVGSLLKGRLYRAAAAGGDTYDADAFGLGVGFLYERSAHGTVKRWP